MTKGSAFVIGATGQIGRAAVRALAEDGWDVTAASRGGGRAETWPQEVRPAAVDREDDAALASALGDGCDVLVDMVAFEERHARQLTGLADRVGSAVVISSGAVYEDAKGRSFDTQDEPDGFPQYPVPVRESLATVAPGDATYGTRKVAIERHLLAAADRLPTTLLRAGAVHGPYCRTPREIHFVKRALDGRPVRILAYGGLSQFHPVHVSNVGELIRLAAARPGARVLNAGDPEVPTVAEISTAIDAVMGVRSELVLVDGPPPRDGLGETPWGPDRPIVYDMSAAERELGYRPVTTYTESLPATVDWLADQLRERDWREAFPKLSQRYGPGDGPFDYAAEDAWLAGAR
ncbi:NAD-dependent epimerase/dehydratase family protein [Streptomyces sp. ISL-96]|uniref:NAD-dependent epimerase/dehydratase family protein n=1 Tax=Streptomyces sp. ISL-96 TaxID=2819191 RepID=UPI001BED0209|nr:NAD-dependent epimerase/dehydratase family protein [Streptomyces sp. ISL-96]MBT2488469.1 NAD-dependent epimerase/dehydratase family protein [Streptomyces sp. ISL-96]